MKTIDTNGGAEPKVSSDGPVQPIRTRKSEDPIEKPDPAAYSSTEDGNGDYVVCLDSHLMGEGDPELGKILMETFLDHLKFQDKLPTHVVMYNGGVRLAMKGTQTCNSLNELEELGCRIMLSGTCVDHYGIQYDIGVGVISNMVTITEIQVRTGHVVTP